MDYTSENILEKRARELARKTTGAQLAGSGIMVVEFLLFPERYAIEAAFVHEVLTLKEITYIPGTPEYVSGVINFRGSIVSVLNLKVLFGLKERGLTEMNKVLLLRNEQMEFGLIADGILGSFDVSLSEISEPPINLSPTGAGFVSGLLLNGAIMLNGANMLESNILVVNQ
jgi:purine-binding chemotaxis protein CheW